jgi:ABC-type lipoprotein release transport system permease subunit
MTSYHPGVTLLAALALALSALFASLIPALHAGSISPMKALREE